MFIVGLLFDNVRADVDAIWIRVSNDVVIPSGRKYLLRLQTQGLPHHLKLNEQTVSNLVPAPSGYEVASDNYGSDVIYYAQPGEIRRDALSQSLARISYV
jgi:hypothetical protein